jgi:hypothetical protein
MTPDLTRSLNLLDYTFQVKPTGFLLDRDYPFEYDVRALGEIDGISEAEAEGGLIEAFERADLCSRRRRSEC